MPTAAQFKTLFPQTKQPDSWTEAINTLCPRHGINTPRDLAMFLAQCGHESDGFTSLRENLNYSAQALATTWPNRYAVVPTAKVKMPNALALSLHRQPEKIANNCYANRLGNGDEASGDGFRFRGYGPIQLTGRGLREGFAKFVGKALAEAEEYILTIEGGIAAACYFWSLKGLTSLTAAGASIEACTKRINGGLNGIEDRKQRYAQTCKLLGIA